MIVLARRASIRCQKKKKEEEEEEEEDNSHQELVRGLLELGRHLASSTSGSYETSFDCGFRACTSERRRVDARCAGGVAYKRSCQCLQSRHVGREMTSLYAAIAFD